MGLFAVFYLGKLSALFDSCFVLWGANHPAFSEQRVAAMSHHEGGERSNAWVKPAIEFGATGLPVRTPNATTPTIQNRARRRRRLRGGCALILAASQQHFEHLAQPIAPAFAGLILLRGLLLHLETTANLLKLLEGFLAFFPNAP